MARLIDNVRNKVQKKCKRGVLSLTVPLSPVGSKLRYHETLTLLCDSAIRHDHPFTACITIRIDRTPTKRHHYWLQYEAVEVISFLLIYVSLHLYCNFDPQTASSRIFSFSTTQRHTAQHSRRLVEFYRLTRRSAAKYLFIPWSSTMNNPWRPANLWNFKTFAVPRVSLMISLPLTCYSHSFPGISTTV